MRHDPTGADPLTGGPVSAPKVTGLFRAGVATLATGLVTAALARITATTAGAALEAAWAPDRAVAAVVLLAGTVAAGVLTLGCLMLAVGALARVAGRSSRWLELAAARLTPVVVRRAVAVTVGAGLSLAGTTGIATAAELDLGWEVTSTSLSGDTAQAPAGAAVQARSTGGPSGQSAGAPLVVAPEASVTGTVPEVPAPASPSSGPASTPGVAEAAPEPAASRPTAPPTASTAPSAPTAPRTATAPPATAPSAPALPSRPATSGAPLVPGAPAPSSAPAAPAPAPSSAPAAPATVLVSSGDTLWSIAADHLPSDAADAEIARAWPQWYQLNRAQIGSDPDVIQPGQQLVVPSTSSTDAPEEQA